jgi:HAD superfamily hydrolase (TIGR01549 family)
MNTQIPDKKAYIFDLDNTLYPEKDYLYQIYYMIGQFVEYQETYEHDKITKFLIDEFEKEGRGRLFDKLIERFSLDASYMENFLRLMRTARLPLKLILFNEMEELLNELVNNKKQIFILTNGTPQQQFNKIMQMEWKGLQHSIRCYFCDEIARKPAPDSMYHLLEENNLKPEDVLFIGDSEEDRICALEAGVEYINVKKLMAIS